jgi:hypothetical protein
MSPGPSKALVVGSAKAAEGGNVNSSSENTGPNKFIESLPIFCVEMRQRKMKRFVAIHGIAFKVNLSVCEHEAPPREHGFLIGPCPGGSGRFLDRTARMVHRGDQCDSPRLRRRPRSPWHATHSWKAEVFVATGRSNNGDLSPAINHNHPGNLIMLSRRVALIDAILVYPEKSHAKISCYCNGVTDKLRQNIWKKLIAGIQWRLPNALGTDLRNIGVFMTPYIAQGSIHAGGTTRDNGESVSQPTSILLEEDLPGVRIKGGSAGRTEAIHAE